MKPTMSKDGELRFTVTIKRRVGVKDLVDGLGWTMVHDGLLSYDVSAKDVKDALKSFNSRKYILAAAASALRADGDSVWAWSDDCAWSGLLIDQARVLVTKKFPELAKTPVKQPENT